MMECIIQRERLLEALQPVVGVVESRQTVPILSHALLEVSNERITIKCTDNEITITSYAAVREVMQTGKVTVSAHTLLEITRRLPHDSLIVLKQHGTQVLVNSGSSHFCLMSLSPDEFPSDVMEAHMMTVSVPERLLYEALKTTHFAMAHNNPRYYLNGMLWDISGNRLELVATDAHRLAQRAITIDAQQSASMILPRKTIIELGKLLTESSDYCLKLGFTENQLSVQGPGYQLTSRLIAGSFPDYKSLLPTIVHRTAIVRSKLLKEALSKLAPLLKQEIHKGVRLVFRHNALTLRVSNSRQETGEESLTLDYSATEDDSFSIAFNIDYLDKILDVLPVGDIELLLPKETGVTMVKQHDPNRSHDHLYLIMPVLL